MRTRSPRRSTISADPLARPITVLAPVAGTVVALADVPDPVFAEQLLGPGIAVRPEVDGVVVAPVDGVVVAGRSHALVVRAGPGRDVLVHLGLDTFALPGGLTVAVGDSVVSGAVVGRWEHELVQGAGLSPICPVVAVQARPGAVEILAEPGRSVRAGEPVLVWRAETPQVRQAGPGH